MSSRAPCAPHDSAEHAGFRLPRPPPIRAIPRTSRTGGHPRWLATPARILRRVQDMTGTVAVDGHRAPRFGRRRRAARRRVKGSRRTREGLPEERARALRHADARCAIDRAGRPPTPPGAGPRRPHRARRRPLVGARAQEAHARRRPARGERRVRARRGRPGSRTIAARVANLGPRRRARHVRRRAARRAPAGPVPGARPVGRRRRFLVAPVCPPRAAPRTAPRVGRLQAFLPLRGLDARRTRVLHPQGHRLGIA